MASFRKNLAIIFLVLATVAVTCFAQTDSGSEPLTVKILGSREPLSAGTEYQLVCQSAGAPHSASITWWLDGRQLTNATTSTDMSGNVTQSTLTFIPTDGDNGKIMACMVMSPLDQHTPLQDQWKIEVYYTPQVTLALGSIVLSTRIREGDDLYFECTINANPSVNRIVWYHNGVQVQHNLSAGVVLSSQFLVMQRVQRQRAGLYTCVASNIEGDCQSNAVLLDVEYQPVCAPGQIHVYSATLHKAISVTCRVNAVPPVVHFNWVFNISNIFVDMTKSQVTSGGLHSSVSYVPRTEQDYGTLFCWGSNIVGRQLKPCIYKVIPAGPPDPPENCSLLNQTKEALRIRCFPGYDGGLTQSFVLEASESDTNRLLLNITENTYPDFTLTGLHPGVSYLLDIYASNEKGFSEKLTMQAYTLIDGTERNTTQMRTHQQELVSLTQAVGVLVGVIGFMVLVAIAAVL